MKKKLLIAVPLLALVALTAWLFRPKHELLGEAYVSEKSVTLWSSVAQVREQLSSLHYGERVDTLAKRNDFVKVRTSEGTVGWVDGRLLMDPALWTRSQELLKRVQSLPVQGSGRTKVATNLRVEPGRTAPRLYQFGRGVPVEILGLDVEHVGVGQDHGQTLAVRRQGQGCHRLGLRQGVADLARVARDGGATAPWV